MGPRSPGAEPGLEASLITAIDAVFTRHERLWQESKQEADPGVVGRLCRQDGARPDRAVGQGRDRQQHLALFRGARRRPHRQVASRPEDQADELRRASPSSSNRFWRSSSAGAGARSASSISPGSSGTTTRSATRSAIGSSSGSRRCCANRCAPTTCWRRSALGADDAPRGSARAIRRRRILLPDSRHRRVPSGARGRRTLPRSGRTLRLDARGSPPVGAAGPRRRRRRLPLAGTRGRPALRRAAAGRRT